MKKLDKKTYDSKGKKDGSDQEVKNVAVGAQKRFEDPQDALRHIGQCINQLRISDFGSYLKGCDYNDDDSISKVDFYQIILNFHEFQDNEGIQEGDIVELMNYFDGNHNGNVDLL